MAAETPSAWDALRGLESSGQHEQRPAERGPLYSAARAVTARSAQADLEAFFNSPPIHELKLQICDIGRRMWQRAYVDGNAGNIAIRVAKDLVLCTPTQVSKGFMKPEDLCLVDMAGNQLAGTTRRTGEILMHLQIMQRQPRAVASVHCHPPYGTAFAVAGIEPPTGMVSEFELFVSVATAPYCTPGTPEIGRLVADLVETHNTILMANHGVVVWSHNHVEDAYFKIEILEAYCRALLIVLQLGKPPKTLTPAQLQDLLKIKQDLGIPDPRFPFKARELGDSTESRPAVTGAAAHDPAPPASPALDDALVQAITEHIRARTMI